jgi:hypothetical protein
MDSRAVHRQMLGGTIRIVCRVFEGGGVSRILGSTVGSAGMMVMPHTTCGGVASGFSSADLSGRRTGHKGTERTEKTERTLARFVDLAARSGTSNSSRYDFAPGLGSREGAARGAARDVDDDGDWAALGEGATNAVPTMMTHIRTRISPPHGWTARGSNFPGPRIMTLPAGRRLSAP